MAKRRNLLEDYEIMKALGVEDKERCEVCSNENWNVYHNTGECPKWKSVKENFDRIFEIYKQFLGQPRMNTSLAIAITFDPLLKRYNAGERSKELYDAMASVE